MSIVIKSNQAYTGLASALPNPYLLSAYPNAATGFSVSRLLRAAYTGKAFRVRRASDSVELDIGFTGREVDVAALASFASGTDAFVSKIYQQAGVGADAVQATTTKQPKIVASGVVLTNNGRPAAQFDGANYSLEFSDASIAKNKAKVFMLAVANTTEPGSGSANSRILAILSSGVPNTRFGVTDESTVDGKIDAIARRLDADSSAIASAYRTSSKLSLFSARANYDLGTVGLKIDSAAVVTSALAGSGNTSDVAAPIVNRIGSNVSSNYWLGYFSELVIYNTDVSASLPAIESNLLRYYAIV